MWCYGALLRLDLVARIEVKAFLKALKLIKPSMSLAGIESTMILPAETSHALLTPEARAEQGIGDNLIRFSLGIESRKDLIADIEQAVNQVASHSVGT